MAILGAGIAVEAITGEQKWLQGTVILLHVTSFPAHPSLDSRQPERLVATTRSWVDAWVWGCSGLRMRLGSGLGMRLGEI